MADIVVIAGPNGAGKSTTAPRLLKDVFHIDGFVNADDIERDLPVAITASRAFAAGREMLVRLHAHATAGRSFAFESTLSSRSFAPLLRQLQEQKYRIHLIYLWLPDAETAVQRVAARVRNGGHAVPEMIVRRRYERSLTNFFDLYRPIADSWLMLDNTDTPDAETPRAIAWRDLHGPVRIARHGPWEKLRECYEQDPFTRT